MLRAVLVKEKRRKIVKAVKASKKNTLECIVLADFIPLKPADNTGSRSRLSALSYSPPPPHPKIG